MADLKETNECLKAVKKELVGVFGNICYSNAILNLSVTYALFG